MSRDHWKNQADNWLAWARTPGFDAYWKYSPAFFELVLRVVARWRSGAGKDE